jgi:NAD(P)-dependent dehydrogenase (short-subunit alcohol dehydrogenase family)
MSAADLVERLARAASWLVDPHGGPDERRLRAAVRGRTVLVTGASFGIGEATARRLARSGARVLLVARSAERLDEVARSIDSTGGEAYPFPADLVDAEQVNGLVASVLDTYGAVDVLVNNAGKSIRRSLEHSYDRFHDFERTIAVNYLGPVRLLLGLLPSMRARRRGHIVNVSTIGVRGLPPAPRWGAYQASKGAFDILVRSAAPELRADGITITSIYMTLVHTRMSAPNPIWRYVPGLYPDEAADLVARAIVERPRVIAPWWRPAAELAALTLGGPLEAALSLAYRATPETPAPGEATSGFQESAYSGLS